MTISDLLSAHGPDPGQNRAMTAPSMLVAGLTAVMLLASGCMSWRPGWQAPLPARVVPGAKATASDELEGPKLLAAARTAAQRADSAARVEQAIALYEDLARRSPADVEALTELSELLALLGAGYRIDVDAKAEAYRAALRYAEQAMATNQRFREQVAAGASVDEACPALSSAELPALHAWTVAVSYYFKECTTGIGHLVNLRWMARHTAAIEHLEGVDPTWGHGAVLFARGVYFLALPRIAGRDLDRSAEYMQRAVEAGPHSLLPRWGRAKYLYSLTGDRQAQLEDLRWVLAQDPTRADSPFAWNVYFQRDARMMLDAAQEQP